MPKARHNQQRREVATTRHKVATGITPRQLDLLLFINSYSRQSGLVPTNREMRRALNLTSSSTIHSHIVRLERHGLIVRDPEMRRNVSITPRGMAICGKYASGRSSEAVNV